MAEETTAACADLASQATMLKEQLEKFRCRGWAVAGSDSARSLSRPSLRVA
jgi:hypothetical protein